MIDNERQVLLDNYATTSRAFSDSVERLRLVGKTAEAFIGALEETGTAHRLCERSRLKLNRYLASPNVTDPRRPTPSISPR